MHHRCEATGRLHWVSQEGDTGVHTLHLSTGEHTSMPTPALTPAVALTSDTDLLAVFLEQRVVLYSLKSGKASRAAQWHSLITPPPRVSGRPCHALCSRAQSWSRTWLAQCSVRNAMEDRSEL